LFAGSLVCIGTLPCGVVCAAVFDDGDENTLRRSKLCLKGSRHFMKS